MTRHFGVKSVYIFAMFIVASLVSQTAVGVNFKEEKFILDITPLKQNSGKPSFDFRNKTRPNNNNVSITVYNRLKYNKPIYNRNSSSTTFV